MKVLRRDDLICPECGKRSYPTEAAAREAMHRAWGRPHERRTRSAMPWRVYECPRGGWWHMASSLPGQAG